MNVKEIGAYLKIKGEMDERTRSLIEEVYPAAKNTLAFVRTAEFSIEKTNEGIELVGTGTVLVGNLAASHFAGCKSIVVILVTMGMESERKIKSTYAVSPTKGVVLDACYSEVIERKLDEEEGKLVASGKNITSRISCGYGDLPIETQRELLDMLNATQIGVFMNESCMLVPNKSVVALVGVKI